METKIKKATKAKAEGKNNLPKTSKNTKNILNSSKNTNNLKKMLSSFENQMIMEKLDAINKSILKLEKRVKDLEDLNLNYLGLIEETNNTVKVLTGEVIQEMEKTEDDETLVSIVTFPDTYKKGGDLN